jgi:hypothetical protein
LHKVTDILITSGRKGQQQLKIIGSNNISMDDAYRLNRAQYLGPGCNQVLKVGGRRQNTLANVNLITHAIIVPLRIVVSWSIRAIRAKLEGKLA